VFSTREEAEAFQIPSVFIKLGLKFDVAPDE
jgi:hypothetical protein